MWPVNAGTTDAFLQAWLDAGAQGDPGFFDRRAHDRLRRHLTRTHSAIQLDLPAGTYALFDEVRDDHSGVSRVFEGMHHVVVLK